MRVEIKKTTNDRFLVEWPLEEFPYRGFKVFKEARDAVDFAVAKLTVKSNDGGLYGTDKGEF